ncbi:hypothetical protein OAN22_02015 [Alphaproteobacteria bacterium]|nr:hypothetical protein [Alphaproteobacteria bacterium]
MCEKPTTTIICNTMNLLEVLSQANPDDFGMSVISAAASMYSSQPLDETIGYHLFLETLNSLKAFGILLEEVHLLSPPPDLGAGDDSIET